MKYNVPTFPIFTLITLSFPKKKKKLKMESSFFFSLKHFLTIYSTYCAFAVLGAIGVVV